MFHDIYPKKLDNHFVDCTPEEKDFIFIFQGTGRKDDTLVMKKEADETISFPTLAQVKAAEPGASFTYRYLFTIEEDRFFLLERAVPEHLPEGFKPEILRSVRYTSPRYLSFAATVGYHLFNWNRDNRFCGRCGAETVHDTKERAFKCPVCGNMIFPRIQPAVIIGLRHGDAICTSRYAGRPGVRGRALLAGFCEIGETAEETVAREVMEEVGLKVKNVTYYKSQPWGFESDLLLGYWAEVDGDTDITLDKEELESAEFVRRSELEEMGNLNSLTATMIEAFRRGEV